MKIIETETIWQSYSQIYRLSHLTDNSQSVVFSYIHKVVWAHFVVHWEAVPQQQQLLL